MRKESVKENRQGCLSRPIKAIFKLFEKFENRRQLVKNTFLTSWQCRVSVSVSRTEPRP